MIPDPVNSSAYSPFLLSSFPYYKDGPLQLRGSYPSTKGRKKNKRFSVHKECVPRQRHPKKLNICLHKDSHAHKDRKIYFLSQLSES
jgi:hypothetical protein